jgi:hypothetical protein
MDEIIFETNLDANVEIQRKLKNYSFITLFLIQNVQLHNINYIIKIILIILVMKVSYIPEELLHIIL